MFNQQKVIFRDEIRQYITLQNFTLIPSGQLLHQFEIRYCAFRWDIVTGLTGTCTSKTTKKAHFFFLKGLQVHVPQKPRYLKNNTVILITISEKLTYLIMKKLFFFNANTFL